MYIAVTGAPHNYTKQKKNQICRYVILYLKPAIKRDSYTKNFVQCKTNKYFMCVNKLGNMVIDNYKPCLTKM